MTGEDVIQTHMQGFDAALKAARRYAFSNCADSGAESA